jgi:hypothetical protein
MFALLALITFILALFKVTLGELNLTILGLAFIATHLLLGAWPFGTPPWQRG